MDQRRIRKRIEQKLPKPGMMETGVPGVQLFHVSEPIRCAPTVYEPCIVAIVSGTKEAILDGRRYEYGHERYMCCPVSMPVEAGTPHTSETDPLLGVYIKLDTRMLTELSIEIERAAPVVRKPSGTAPAQGLTLARWDDAFEEALFRLINIGDATDDLAVLANGRLREFYYAVLKGDAGDAARHAFGVGNDIARAITYLSSRLNEPVTIDDAAGHVGMSRAVFHRKFKQATMLSPMQYVKAMRLNNAAMKIAGGTHVNVAAMEVGYVSSSQFSREFKRMYGQTPKSWSQSRELALNLA